MPQHLDDTASEQLVFTALVGNLSDVEDISAYAIIAVRDVITILCSCCLTRR